MQADMEMKTRRISGLCALGCWYCRDANGSSEYRSFESFVPKKQCCCSEQQQSAGVDSKHKGTGVCKRTGSVPGRCLRRARITGKWNIFSPLANHRRERPDWSVETEQELDTLSRHMLMAAINSQLASGIECLDKCRCTARLTRDWCVFINPPVNALSDGAAFKQLVISGVVRGVSSGILEEKSLQAYFSTCMHADQYHCNKALLTL